VFKIEMVEGFTFDYISRSQFRKIKKLVSVLPSIHKNPPRFFFLTPPTPAPVRSAVAYLLAFKLERFEMEKMKEN